MKPAQLSMIFMPLALFVLPSAYGIANATADPVPRSVSLAAMMDGKLDLRRDSSELEEMIVGLAQEGAVPDLKPFLDQIIELIDETIDDVYDEWNKTWEMMRDANKTFEDIYMRNSYHGDMDDLAWEHYHCRLIEQQAYTDYSLMCARADDRRAEMQTSCESFHGDHNVINPDIPEICEPNGHLTGQPDADSETNEGRAERLAAFYHQLSAQWKTGYRICSEDINESKAADLVCMNRTEIWNDWETKCDRLQHHMDWVGCHYYKRNNCSIHYADWRAAQVDYYRLNATVFRRKDQHMVEFGGLMRIRCIIQAVMLQDQGTDAMTQGIEQCRYTKAKIALLPEGKVPEINPLYCEQECWPNHTDSVFPWIHCPYLPAAPGCAPGGPPHDPFPMTDLLPGTEKYKTAYLEGMPPWRVCPIDNTTDPITAGSCQWPQNALPDACKAECCISCDMYEGCSPRPKLDNAKDVTILPGIWATHAHMTCCQLVSWKVSPWSDRCPIGCGFPASERTRNVSCIGQDNQQLHPDACNDPRMNLGPQPPEKETCPATAVCDTTCLEPCANGMYRTGCADGTNGGRCEWCEVSVQTSEYIGCFTDTSTRDMQVGHTLDNNNTPAACAETCVGYKYFGLQSGKECFCGDSYGSHGPATGCNMECSGDSSIKCGDSYKNSVYEITSEPQQGFYFITPGTFTPNSCGTARCDRTRCNTGQYLANCSGWNTIGTCAPCRVPFGHYVTGGGFYTPSSCPVSPCESCPNGQYRKDCGASGPGTCEPCTPVEGKYFIAPGEPNSPTSCPATDCLKDCPIGQHRVGCAGGSAGTCQNCTLPPNTYAIDFGRMHDRCSSTRCVASKCAAGNYLKDCAGAHSGTCAQCNPPPFGFWYPNHGAFDPNCPGKPCGTCPVGYWKKGCGGDTPTHGGDCVQCTPPPKNQYHTGSGGIRDACPVGNCTNEKCPTGQYRWGCGGNSIGACVACDPPIEGRYNCGDGGVLPTCRWCECDPTRCGVGKYLRGCGGRANPGNKGVCVPCTHPREHYYLSTHGGNKNTCTYASCKDLPGCPVGEYRKGCGGRGNSTGIGYCTPCTNGEDGKYFSSHGGLDNSCQKLSCAALAPCDNGHYRKDCGTFNAPASAGECSPCEQPPFGKYVSASPCVFSECTELPVYNCKVGEYLAGCGVGFAGESDAGFTGRCIPCSQPANKMYYIDNGGLKDACPEASCESPDLQCGIGQYLRGCGNLSCGKPVCNGTCANCDPPTAGNFIVGHGGLASTCEQKKCLDMQSCQPGQYLADCGKLINDPGECKACVPPTAGFYYAEDSVGVLNDTSCAMTPCLDSDKRCPMGEYLFDCGGTDPRGKGTCKACADPPSNMYIVGPGELNETSCPMESCLNVANCAPGQYRDGCGGPANRTGIGHCRKCAAPPKNVYYTQHGGLINDCKDKQCSSLGNCPVGQFRDKCGGPDNPTYAGECVPCSPPPLGKKHVSHGGLEDNCQSAAMR